MAPESVESKPAQPTPLTQKEAGPAKGGFLPSLGLLTLEIILPAVLSGGALWFLFRNFNLWQLNRTLALVLFALALVVMSSMFGIFLDTVTSKKRKGYRKRGVKFGTGEFTRLVKLALGGVLLPLALFTAGCPRQDPGWRDRHGPLHPHVPTPGAKHPSREDRISGHSGQ